MPVPSVRAAGTTYYVDNAIAGTCADYNPAAYACSGGTARAFKTVAEVNAASFAPGDSILFRRGQVWREGLIVPSSGAAGSPIIFGAFGVGANPVLNRTEVFTKWWEYNAYVRNNNFQIYTGTVDDGIGDNFTNWTETAGAGVVVEAAASGHEGSALKIGKPTAAAADAKAESDGTFTLAAGTAYYLEFYGKRLGGSGDCRMALKDNTHNVYLNEDGNWTADADGEVLNPGSLRVSEAGWTKKSKSFTTPLGADSFTLSFSVKNDQAAVCGWDSLIVNPGTSRTAQRVWAGYATSSMQTSLLDAGNRVLRHDPYDGPEPASMTDGYFRNYGDSHNIYYRKDSGFPSDTQVGMVAYGLYAKDKSYVDIENLDVYGPAGGVGFQNGANALTGLFLAGSSHHMTIKDLTISYGDEYGSWTDFGTSFITFDGITSHHNGDAALYFNPQGGTIKNCVVYDNGRLATDTGDRGGISIWQGGVVTMRGDQEVVIPPERLNYEPITVEDNVAYRNGASDGMSDSEIIAVAPMRPIYILRNHTYDCNQSCIMIAGGEEGADGSVVAYNVVEGFGTISFQEARESYGLYAGIRIGGGDGGVADVKIYNNTIAGGGGSIAGNYRAGIAAQLAETTHLLIENNLFYNNQLPEIAIDDNVSSAGMSIGHNMYYRASGDYGDAWNWYEHSYSTLSAWQTASGQDAGSALGNPLFVNGSGSYSLVTDYELGEGSPAIDAGAAIAGGSDADYLGHALAGNPDLGAFEFIPEAFAAAPTFSPAAGTYSSAQSVTLASATSGASIRYTTDGSTPTAASAVYSSPISVSSSRTVKAIAIGDGYQNSPVASAAYTINISSGGGGGGGATKPTTGAPSFSHKGGKYNAKLSVTLSSATAGASIYYTLDGATPTSASRLYAGAIEVASSLTVKAVAMKSGYTNSPVASEAYVIDPNDPTAPAPSGYSDGTLLKTSDSFKVYVVMDGKKKWISTPEVFEQLGYKWTSIAVITKDRLAALSDYEDNLIRTIGDYKVYLVVNGVRRHIPNPEIFLGYGFAWGDVKDVPAETVNKYKAAFLLKESGKEGIWFITGGVRKLIPTIAIFDSYGDKLEDVQVVSKAELESYPLTGLIRLGGANDVYLVEGAAKKLVPSVAVFNKYKFDWTRIISVNRTEFDYYADKGVLD